MHKRLLLESGLYLGAACNGATTVYHGAPKLWYIIPSEYGPKFEELCKRLFPTLASECSAFLRHKQCMVGPKQLEKNNIPYHRIIQCAGEIVIGN